VKKFLVPLVASLALLNAAVLAQDPAAEPGTPPGKPKFTEEVLRLQIFLDGHLFGRESWTDCPVSSPSRRSSATQWAHGLPQSSTLESHRIDLAASVPELYTTYTIREEDRNLCRIFARQAVRAEHEEVSPL